MEANVEFRFPLMGDLHGALFVDAGNIWLLKNDPNRPGGTLKWKGLLNEVALGCATICNSSSSGRTSA